MIRVAVAVVAAVLLADVPNAAHAVPPSVPNHFAFGLGAGQGDTWMPQSGIAWDYRFQYLAGGVNTNAGWETWNANGTFALNYAKESSQHSYIPMFPYYELLQSSGSCGACSENQKDITNLNTPALMNVYYQNFALLMKRLGPGTYDGIAGYGSTAFVNIEPDFVGGYAVQAANNNAVCFGFCTGQGNDPTFLKASVASSGYADVAAYPNTYAGFVQALAHLRDLYAPNVLLGLDVSPWATGDDIGLDSNPNTNVTALGQQVGMFLSRAGAHDLLFNDPLDRDAGQYMALFNQNRWWDRLNVTFPNFQRWEQYLNAARTADGNKSILLWQVPVGNQYFDTENNTDGHYQDNRAEYIFSHVPELMQNGIIGALFMPGNAGSTTYSDGKNDGVTNPASFCTNSGTSSGQICNNHTSSVADDDGGFVRMSAQQYYASPVALSGAPAATNTPTATATATLTATLAPTLTPTNTPTLAPTMTLAPTATSTPSAPAAAPAPSGGGGGAAGGAGGGGGGGGGAAGGGGAGGVAGGGAGGPTLVSPAAAPPAAPQPPPAMAGASSPAPVVAATPNTRQTTLARDDLGISVTAPAAGGGDAVGLRGIASLSAGALAAPPAGFTFGTHAFEVDAASGTTGQAVSQLPAPLSVTVNLSPDEVAAAGGDWQRLHLALSSGGSWIGLSCDQDAVARTLQCSAPWPGQFAVLVAPAASGPADWDISNGHVFKQANGFGGAGDLGYAVTDDQEASFWSEFQRMGGLEAVGYPISGRFKYRGFLTQAFQKLVLQWRPELGRAVPVNVFDELDQRGSDAWLDSSRQTPPPAPTDADQGLGWEAVVSRHVSMLEAYPALGDFYTAQPDAIDRFGLPVGVADYGPLVSARLQRATLQLWKVDTPWAAAGSVVVGNGGDVAKEAGLWPRDALSPVALSAAYSGS